VTGTGLNKTAGEISLFVC